MGFSSIQAYLDPSNWQQQQNHPVVIGSTSSNPNNLLPPPPHPPHGAGSIRPGSMSERARLANIPMPDAALKCPRCESTNTKFCYFNNYSLSQPRHFCKSCRRYWTRGGALRNVPVGGGYRRNKRSKSLNSKSPATGNTTSSASNISSSCNNSTANILGLTPQLRFMSPLSQLSDHGFAADVGLNYNGMSNTSPMLSTSDHNISFHGSGINNNLLGHGGMSSLLSSGGIEPWKLHQYPFLAGGLESQSTQGIFNQFQGGVLDHDNTGFVRDETSTGGGGGTHVRPKGVLSSSSSMMSQLASMKMEDNNLNSHETNVSRQLLSGMSNGNELWNRTSNDAWTELSSFSSSSTSKPLQ